MVSDIATGQDISRAALQVIKACVFNDEGGYLSGVGTYISSVPHACYLRPEREY